MPKVALTHSLASEATCPSDKTKTVLWDRAVNGFTLEVRSTGGKTYYLRYFDQNGRQRQHKIGRFEDLTFAQAKKEAIRLRSEVVLGGDPAKAKEKKRSVPTYAQLAAQHLEHAKSYQRRPGNTESVLRLHLLPKWGKLRLDEIQQQDVAKWLGEKREQGLSFSTVEKIRIMLNRSFELAKRWQIPGAEINPVHGIARPRYSNKREEFLTSAGAKTLIEAAGRSSNPQLKPIVQLLLLTGARKSELLQARWSEIDLERRSWHIPDSKTGKPRYVPLSSDAVKVIEGLVEIPNCPWLLPNPETRKPYSDIKRAWDKARSEAGLAGLRLHDLRHSAASFMINAGIDLYAVGRILGHADHQSTMRYSHLADATLLAAVEAGAAGMRESS